MDAVQPRGKRPYMLSQRLGDASPAVKLALAVIQQAIQDANWQEPSEFILGARGGTSPHTVTRTEDDRFTRRVMRDDARTWLQSGEWQRTTDLIGIDRQAIIEYLIRNCEWYRI